MFGRNDSKYKKEGPITPFIPVISAGLTALTAAKTLFTKTPKMQEAAPVAAAPAVSAPTVMPTADSASVLEARRLSLQQQASRGGRASTILTENDSFGGS